MKVIVGNNIFDNVMCTCVSEKVLSFSIPNEHDLFEIKENITSSDNMQVQIVYDEGDTETFDVYTVFDRVEELADSNSIWIYLTTTDYVEAIQEQTIEEQITDLQLAIVELYEMLEV